MTSELPDQPEPDAVEPATAEPAPGAAEWLETVRAMIQLFERSDAHEVRLGVGSLRLRLRRGAEAAYRPISFEPMVVHHSLHTESATLHDVRAPLTGIWYDAPSPGASPYVQVGSHVEVGSVIGLIETMKIFNDISADAAGRVAQIHVRRADLVQVNAPLLSIDTADTADLWPRRT